MQFSNYLLSTHSVASPSLVLRGRWAESQAGSLWWLTVPLRKHRHQAFSSSLSSLPCLLLLHPLSSSWRSTPLITAFRGSQFHSMKPALHSLRDLAPFQAHLLLSCCCASLFANQVFPLVPVSGPLLRLCPFLKYCLCPFTQGEVTLMVIPVSSLSLHPTSPHLSLLWPFPPPVLELFVSWLSILPN